MYILIHRGILFQTAKVYPIHHVKVAEKYHAHSTFRHFQALRSIRQNFQQVEVCSERRELEKKCGVSSGPKSLSFSLSLSLLLLIREPPTKQRGCAAVKN